MKIPFPVYAKLVVAAFAVLGLWLVVVKPLGPNWALLPGDLGDARYCNYVLEHFYRWISGVDAHYWTASFFYPFPDTIAFSENLLGSAPIYAIFRYIGFDRESAFQGWYVLGFCLNLLAATYVLSRLQFSPLAQGTAAFFFAFGLPLLAQDLHAQLLYRFGIPLACFFLYQMLESPRLLTLVAVLFWSIWQFYLSIYTGVFLVVLLIMLVVLSPLVVGQRSISEVLRFWPSRVKLAWQRATPRSRLLGSSAFILLSASLAALLWPYWRVSKLYGFGREWYEVAMMLPRWQSYLVADRAQLWRVVSALIAGLPMRQEHQLFPGIAATISGMIGVGSLISHRNSGNRSFVMLHVLAGAAVVALTFLFHGFTLYRIIWTLPGLNSIRAVTRIMLVLMWPLALAIGYGVDALKRRDARLHVSRAAFAVALTGLLVAESVLFDHATYSKAGSQARVNDLRAQLPDAVPDQPILILANTRREPLWIAEMDGMMLAQDLGWPTLNGDSGNTVPHFEAATRCSTLPNRLLAYMHFAGIDSSRYYIDTIKRAVPVGFDDCDPGWWTRKPSVTSLPGSLSQDIYSSLSLKVVALRSAAGRTTAQVEVTNNSSLRIPARSSSGNPFQLAWHFAGAGDRKPWSASDTRMDLEFDVAPHGEALLTIDLAPPNQPGHYFLEVTAVQQGIASSYDRGTPIARSAQQIVVDVQNHVVISTAPIP